nr:serine/threonine-protein kinase/endoribonuclease IRE1b-like [Tanacetum cinerariifolium]
PTAVEVYHHPLFWNPEFRLSFLRDTRNYVDFEDRVPDSSVLKALESISTVVLGGKWDEKLDKILLKDVTHYRKYKYDSIRNLLRLIRNKSNNYRELSEEVQEVLGLLPTGLRDIVMLDLEDSTVTYTEAPPTPKFVSEPVYPEFMSPEDDVLLAEEQPLPIVVSPTADSPGYIPESNLKEDHEEDPEEDDEDPDEDPTYYPTDREDDDEEEEESFGDDVDDEEEDKEEEEEHPASADSI